MLFDVVWCCCLMLFVFLAVLVVLSSVVWSFYGCLLFVVCCWLLVVGCWLWLWLLWLLWLLLLLLLLLLPPLLLLLLLLLPLLLSGMTGRKQAVEMDTWISNFEGWKGRKIRNATNKTEENRTAEQETNSKTRQVKYDERITIITPALTASLQCTTMTCNDLLYDTICIIMYPYGPYVSTCIYDIPWFYMASKWPEMSKPAILAKLRAKWPGNSSGLNMSQSEIKKRLIRFFAFCRFSFTLFLHYFALLYRHCHPTCPADGGL